MRKLSVVTFFFILALTAWTQQAQAPVEITAEPHHHLVVENNFVRAFAFSVDPGQSTLMHRHGHDYVSVFIGDSQAMNAKEGAQPAPASFKDGDVKFAPAVVVHAVTDTGSTPVRNATIELLQPTTNAKACTESCAVPVTCAEADKATCATVVKAFASDQWTVTMVTIPVGGKYPEHTHTGGVLTVALTDADVIMRSPSRSKDIHSKVGDIMWHEPETHTIINSGKTVAKVAVLEFKGAAPAGK
jgi:quercetin dioxygenase-like cupin family protein